MIPVCEPSFCGNEKKYVDECIETGWISSEGAFVKRFEKEFPEYIGKQYGIAVSNGSASLETALYALGIQPGDQIIIPTFTIISCATSILRFGAVPILVDIDPDTWCMNTDQIENLISERTKAIMPVHIYGHPVDMDPVIELAKKYGLYIIEDGAEAIGSEYKGKKCGSFGDVSCFSFYANKLISCGEGGMVLTDNKEFADRARSYRNLCFDLERNFIHNEIGQNFRISNLQAAVGCAQLEQVESALAKKIELGEYYHSRLCDIPGIKLQIEKPWAKTSYWMFCVQIPKEFRIDAQTMMNELRKVGIQTRPFFYGIHKQPCMKGSGSNINDSFPVSDLATDYGLYLPSSLTLSNDQINMICDSFKEILFVEKKQKQAIA